jgi:hypothetical protein
MKAYWRSGGIAPRLLDLGTRCRWVVSFTPRPRISLDEELVWAEHVARMEKEKNAYKIWWENLFEHAHLEYREEDARMILKLILGR